MMVVVTGGSGSGKSAFAEDTVLSFGNAKRYYIATMYPFDEESRQRVKRHQAMRAGKGFQTIECFTGLNKVTVSDKSVVLLECMSNLAAYEMFREDGAHEHMVEAILDGVRRLRERAAHLVIVTNEICSEAEQYAEETQRYRKQLGEINCAISEMADQVVEVVYGIPVCCKREKRAGT